MSIEMIVGAVQKQLEATKGPLSDWRPEAAEMAERVAETEDAIIVMFDRPNLMRRVVERVWQSHRAGQIANLFQTRHRIAVLFDLATREAHPIKNLIVRAQQAGYRVERAAEFERAVREMEELRDEFKKTFPVVTATEAAQDRTALAGGDYVDAEDAFARRAGVDVATWRQRVADYESGRPG
jgi:hypothetical protein